MTDDKTQVILAVTAICICAMIIFGVEAREIVSNAIAGLFGVAVGRSLSK